MKGHFLTDALGWGFILWLIGYVLGIGAFALVPVSLIGWVVMPIGAIIAIWVAFSKVKGDTMRYFALVALAWVVIAVLGDYLFIVKAFNPADGYYKLDVYVYYAFTVVIPLVAGWRRTQRAKPA